MIKALFLDIDGTLVSMTTHRIPDSAIAAVKLAKRKGIKIFIATGRPKAIINNISQLEDANLIDGYITMNGACVIVEDKAISKNIMSKYEVQTILEFCKENGVSCPVISENDAWVFQPTPKYDEIFYGTLNVRPLRTCSIEDALKTDIFQLTPFLTEEEKEPLHKLIPDCEFVRWHPDFADVGASGSTKAGGIDTLAKHFGFTIEETMAIGDGGNDITMLKHAKIGVAMGNASSRVKAVANYVTSHIDENGLYNALSTFIL